MERIAFSAPCLPPHSLCPLQFQSDVFPGKAQHSIRHWSPTSPAECKVPMRAESDSGGQCWLNLVVSVCPVAGDSKDDSSRADPFLMPSQHKKYLISAGNFFTSGLTIPCSLSLSASQLPCPSSLFSFASPHPQGHGKLPGKGQQQCRHRPPSQHTQTGCIALLPTLAQGRAGRVYLNTCRCS